MARFRVGLDSYCLQPLQLPPLEVLCWAQAHSAEGVQFSELNVEGGLADAPAFLAELAAAAGEAGLYLEWGGGQHIPFDMKDWRPVDLRPINQRAAAQASVLGTPIIRSCSGGLMRWGDEAPPTEVLLKAMAQSLREQMSMLADHGVTLAIETHFEFTTFELLRVFEMCDAQPGGPLGVCLDTMNLLTMLEDPVAATERILPWVVATHAKDGCISLHDEGLLSFPTPIGAGDVDFAQILRRLATLDRAVNLSVELHGGEFIIPIFDAGFLAKFPELTAAEFASLIAMAHRLRQRPAERRCRPMERSDWPEHCEKQTADGIDALNGLVADTLAESRDDGNA